MSGFQDKQKSESVRSANQPTGIGQRKCLRCQKIKPIDEFYIRNDSRDGHAHICKKCTVEKVNQWRKDNPEKTKKQRKKYNDKSKEKFKQWQIKNTDKLKEKKRIYYQKNKEYICEKVRFWREINPTKAKENRKKHYEKNKQKYIKKAKAWSENNPVEIKKARFKSNKRRRQTLKVKLSDRISSGINMSLKNGSKNGRHWETLVGFTISQLKKHLGKQFVDGMSWENMGEWHIDHIIPVSAFNFEKPEDDDFKRCWAFENLRPLWAKENLKKSNKLEKPFQPSLIF